MFKGSGFRGDTAYQTGLMSWSMVFLQHCMELEEQGLTITIRHGAYKYGCSSLAFLVSVLQCVILVWWMSQLHCRAVPLGEIIMVSLMPVSWTRLIRARMKGSSLVMQLATANSSRIDGYQ